MEKYYKILGVPPGTNKIELKKVYRKLATQHHPDMGGNEEYFKKISSAYELLIGKRKLSRQEKREQERQRNSYVEPQTKRYEYHKPRRPKPKPSPRRISYQHDVYEKCSSCKGKGLLQRYCEYCFGTGNVADPKDGLSYCSCERGYEILWRCAPCKATGKIFVKTETRYRWEGGY